MLGRIIRAVASYRLPIPERYLLPQRYAPAVFISTFLIVFGILSLLIAAYFGTHLFNQHDSRLQSSHKATKAEIDLVAFELRAHAYTEVAAMETIIFRQSLESFRTATAQDQREAALRLAKEVRAQALRHLAEAEAIALPPGKQPDIADLRASIAELDRQLAALPGTQGN